jgi:F-type H+-transporting ATPase subunit b
VRTRTTLSLLGVLALGSLALAGPAWAQETSTEPERTHENEECLEILEADPEASPDECHEAPNPILPETNEIVWGTISFAVLFFVMWKFALPAVRTMVENREQRIRGDLERAEHARTEAESALGDYQRQLADARAEAGRIIDEARQAADQVRRDLVARAETDAAELRARSQEDIRLATERAMADLRVQVADLSIDLAEKIVERSLDRDTQRALIERYIDQVGSN